jgi:hypothetical protein
LRHGSGTLLLTFIGGTIIVMHIALQGPRCDLEIHSYKGLIIIKVDEYSNSHDLIQLVVCLFVLLARVTFDANTKVGS